MNYGELKTMLIDWSHRADLEPHMSNFINAATERINRRFGLRLSEMSSDLDSNTVLTHHGRTLYLPAAMRELSIYIKDFDEGIRFNELFEMEARRMNIHNRDEDWTTDSTVLTHVRNETETALIEEEIASGA